MIFYQPRAQDYTQEVLDILIHAPKSPIGQFRSMYRVARSHFHLGVAQSVVLGFKNAQRWATSERRKRAFIKQIMDTRP